MSDPDREDFEVIKGYSDGSGYDLEFDPVDIDSEHSQTGPGHRRHNSPDFYDRAVDKQEEEYSERLSNEEELKLDGPKQSFFLDKQVKTSTRYLYENKDDAVHDDENHNG